MGENNPITVSLDLRAPGDWQKKGIPKGWKLAKNTNDFIYKFSGGNDGSGDGSLILDGESTIKLDIGPSQGPNPDKNQPYYAIYNVGFYNSDGSLSRDFTEREFDSEGRSVMITDLDHEGPSQGYFKAWIQFYDPPNDAVTMVECDPGWKNEN